MPSPTSIPVPVHFPESGVRSSFSDERSAPIPHSLNGRSVTKNVCSHVAVALLTIGAIACTFGCLGYLGYLDLSVLIGTITPITVSKLAFLSTCLSGAGLGLIAIITCLVVNCNGKSPDPDPVYIAKDSLPDLEYGRKEHEKKEEEKERFESGLGLKNELDYDGARAVVI